ncbi:MAG: hypothetical protein P0S94_03570, partial [Simkaniaceae bacterium]|nr:hypothetical protein [Simkaniaceae bacterium]
MSQLDYIKHVIYTPTTYFRRFDFDLSGVEENVKRVSLVALPFIALYRPVGQVMSIGMGGMRAITHLSGALQGEKDGDWQAFTLNLGHTTLAVISIAATCFNFTIGLFITTSFDLLHATYLCGLYLSEGKYEKAIEEGLQAVASGFYLGFMAVGSLELIMISTLTHAAISLYQAKGDIHEGRYLEAGGKIAMGMIRLNQANHYRELIVARDALFAMQKYQSLIHKALKGREVRHLVSSPLENLNGVIEEKDVVLGNQSGEFDFGAHFHGHGKGLVKGANLAFKQVVVDGKEMTQLEFKVNHAFREQLEKSIAEMAKYRPKELREILQFTGSHVENITTETITTGEFWAPQSTSKITLVGLGTISVGASPEAVNSYDRVVIQMDASKTLYDLHEMIAFADLDMALCASTQDDIDRLKMGHLFRTFFPSSALPFERTDEFFSLPTDELRAVMFEKEPEMERVFNTYFDKMSEAEILPGRVRYRIEGLADEVRALGGVSLTSAVTGWDHTDEAFHKRIESLITMGMLSAETRANNGIDYEG